MRMCGARIRTCLIPTRKLRCGSRQWPSLLWIIVCLHMSRDMFHCFNNSFGNRDTVWQRPTCTPSKSEQSAAEIEVWTCLLLPRAIIPKNFAVFRVVSLLVENGFSNAHNYFFCFQWWTRLTAQLLSPHLLIKWDNANRWRNFAVCCLESSCRRNWKRPYVGASLLQSSFKFRIIAGVATRKGNFYSPINDSKSSRGISWQKCSVYYLSVTWSMLAIHASFSPVCEIVCHKIHAFVFCSEW